jgi:hypothetical protein
MSTGDAASATGTIVTENRGRLWRFTRLELLAMVWSILVCGVLAWQAFTYRGVIAWASEWQFATLHMSFPAFTAMLFAAVLILPVLFALSLARRRNPPPPATLLATRAYRLYRLLAFGLVVAGIAGLALIGWTLALPGDHGPVRTVNAVADTRPPEGRALIVGQVRLDRAVTYENRLGFLTRIYRYAPVEPAHKGDPLRYFVELPEIGAPQQSGATRGGVLQHNGLPGPVRSLYVDAGYQVAPDAYTLNQDSDSISWPYTAVGAQLLIIALVLGIALLLQRRNLRRADALLTSGA